MRRKVISVLGSNGMLGHDVAQAFFNAGHLVRCWKRPAWDICRVDDIEAAVKDSDIVINCAAYTDVDQAQKDRAGAYLTNQQAARNVAIACEKYGAYGVHFSTDYVFDGSRRRAYTEEDLPNPLNYYGRSKLAGEGEFLRHHPNGCVIRLQWSYGSNGFHFLSKLLGWAQRNGRLMVVDDQFGAPTWTTDIAEMLGKLAVVRPTGVFHYAANGETSRFGIAQLLGQELGLSVPVFGCGSGSLPARAPRPQNSLFDCSKIDQALDITRPHWQDSMRRFIAAEYAEWTAPEIQEVSA